MKEMVLAAIVMLSGTAVWAEIPFLNASCPTGIEVHADEHGPIYINGTEAKITSQNDNYVEAREGHTTISVMINSDGTLDVSYTGANGANGICQVQK